MNDRLAAIIAEFRPALLWVIGMVVGFLIIFSGSFFLGLIIVIGCGVMVKVKLGQGAAKNLARIQGEVASVVRDRIGSFSGKSPRQAEAWDQDKFAHAVTEAKSAWEAGDRENAANKLEHALQMRPDEADGWFLLGKWADSLSAPELTAGGELPNVHRAINALERATTLDPNNAAAFALLSDAYRPLDFRQSLDASQKSSKIDKQYERFTIQLEEIVKENWHCLAECKTYRTTTMRSEPSEKMLLDRWYFNDVFGSVDGSSTNKSLFGLIFENEEPDFERESPIATLQIEQPSSGWISSTVTRLKR
jgi:tetratricopeptide (TPR) repeat protein